MLVLSRHASESIHIGADIVVEVLQTSRHQVRIGVRAPRHVRITRSELITKAATVAAPPPAHPGSIVSVMTLRYGGTVS